ncbi:hypothetical protein ECEC1849_1176, partial [Escherichia coli EC1849]
MKYIYP